MSEYREAERKWLTLNPLRQWRATENLFLKDVGAALGVGYHTIFRWENGMSMPNEDQMTALSKLSKNENLQEEFQKWKDSRPLLGKEKNANSK
jgi:DNA-binding transcriptional regulator YiaG